MFNKPVSFSQQWVVFSVRRYQNTYNSTNPSLRSTAKRLCLTPTRATGEESQALIRWTDIITADIRPIRVTAWSRSYLEKKRLSSSMKRPIPPCRGRRTRAKRLYPNISTTIFRSQPLPRRREQRCLRSTHRFQQLPPIPLRCTDSNNPFFNTRFLSKSNQ